MFLHGPDKTIKTETWKIDYTQNDNQKILEGSAQLKLLGPLQPNKVYTTEIVLSLKSKIEVSKDGENFDATLEQRYVHNLL